MKFKPPVVLLDLVGHNYNIEGDRNILIHGVGVVSNANAGDICFAENTIILNKLLVSKCNAIITNKHLFTKTNSKKGKTFVITDNPSKLVDKILKDTNLELPSFSFNASQHNNNNSKVALEACIDKEAQIGSNCLIYPQVFIDKNVIIGNFATIYPGTKIFSKTNIGNNVILKSNSIIGNDPNWQYKDNDLYNDFVSVGGVIIGDSVTVGANTVIDKGLVEDTTISSNCKIGNNVQIGHEVTIENNVLIISQSGIAGGTYIGKNTTIYGQCGINSNLYIAPNTVINGKTIITADIKENGKSYFGIPGEEKKFYSRKQSALNKLPRIMADSDAFKLHGDLPSKISTIISEQLSVDPKKLKTSFDFMNDGGADSLDMIELIVAIEQEFNIKISEEEADKIKTISSLYKLLIKKGIKNDKSLQGKAVSERRIRKTADRRAVD